LFATLLFDVEDFVTRESDDILNWLAQTLTEENASGTFLIVGEKARTLETRGRNDVIDSVRKHDIGFHSNYHSMHPTVSEYLEKVGWEKGCQEIRNREIPGLRDVEKIFKKETSCFTPPGSSYGAQLIYVLGKLGKAYMYSPVYLPSRSVNWFCGALTFSRRSIFYTDEEYCGFDKLLAQDDKFQIGLERLERYLKERYDRGTDWVGIFCCHPTRVGTLEFWDDVNFTGGRNPARSDWKKPKLRSEQEIEVAKKNFRRLVKFLVSNNLIELKTIGELVPLYSSQKAIMTYEKICEISEKISHQKQIVLDNEYSLFEIILGMADFLLERWRSHGFKGTVKVRKGLGPMDEPATYQDEFTTDYSFIFKACKDLDSFVRRRGFLPSSITIASKKVGIGSLYHVLADAITMLTRQNVKPAHVFRKRITLDRRQADPYPSIPKNLCEEMTKDIRSWTIHRQDLNAENIIKYFRLQSWTLKPAMLVKR